jgi:hypothetical protein
MPGSIILLRETLVYRLVFDIKVLQLNEITGWDQMSPVMKCTGHKIALFCVGAFVVLEGYRNCPAQNAAFYYGSGVAVDPVISVLAVGVNEQVQRAVVSQDRKHVMLDIDTTYSIPLGMQTFQYQTSGFGFVGSATAAKAAAPAVKQSVVDDSDMEKRDSLLPSIARTPSDLIASQPTILDRPGMVMIARLGAGK